VVLKVCAAPMPVPSQLVPDLPKAFDDWFARACARDLGSRFRRVGEMADALRRLDEWSRAQREQVAYEIRPLASSMVDIEEPRPSSRGLVLGGVLAGVALTLGALGYFVVQKTRAADEAARAAGERATAVIEAENERRLREAEKRFWDTQPDAGPAASGSASGTSTAGARPAKKRPR
jgi:hypothetical protein